MGKIFDAINKAKTGSGGRPQTSRSGKVTPDRPVLQNDVVQIQPDPMRQFANRIIGSQTAPGVVAAYKMLRTRLLHLTRANNWNVIAVTSPAPNDGKTLTAANLAIVVAQEGNQNVFLVDLDLRNPSVSKYLAGSADTSIVDFYEGAKDIAEIVYSPGLPNLYVIGNDRPAMSNSSEVIAAKRTGVLIDELRSMDPNGLFLFDLPPVLPTDDVLAFAPHIDGVLFVVSEGQTTREGIVKSYELLKSTGVEIVGVVLNRSAELNSSDYY